MNELNNFEIDKIINNFAENNKGKFDLSLSQIEDVKEMFSVLMKDEVNKNKTKLEQKSLIEDLIIGKSYNETSSRLMRSHSSNKHLDFFDTFLGEGEGDKIQKILADNNISTGVLRGVKAKMDINIKVDTDQGVVGIKGKIEPSPDGTNQANDFFEISLNGKQLYSWRPTYMLVNLYDISDDEYATDYNEGDKQPMIKVPNIEKAVGQKTVKKVEEITSDTKRITQFYYTKKGNLAYRTVENGKFVGGGLV